MKDKRIFNINEIITIVMEEVRVKENNMLYGIDEEGNYPKYICDKFNMLSEDEFHEFMTIIEEIVETISEMKSGELNELNKCHEEIVYIAKDNLNKYMYD